MTTPIKKEPGIPQVTFGATLPPLPQIESTSSTKNGHTNDYNVNITYKRLKPDPPEEKDPNKKMKYKVIGTLVDTNRDLYFVKLVAGAQKRRFQSLIEIEGNSYEKKTLPIEVPIKREMEEREREVPIKSETMVPQIFERPTFEKKTRVTSDVEVLKYSYSTELLHAWTTVIEKIKNMLEPTILGLEPGWETSERIHESLIKRDSTVTAFARYVAFVMLSETNNFIPRNRTRYVLEMDQQIEGQRIFDMMKALKNEYNVLDTILAERYGI